MAVDGYMYFIDYQNNYQYGESQVETKDWGNDPFWKDGAYGFKDAQSKAPTDPGLFEIEDFSFDIEQVLNIGSQSTGAGAGKVTFNPFSITRKIDRFSPKLFQASCSGTPYKKIGLGLRKASGGTNTGTFFLTFLFKLAAVKTISWSYDDESPKETVTFEYGALQCYYTPQKPDGSMGAIIASGWNRVKNIRDDDAKSEIK